MIDALARTHVADTILRLLILLLVLIALPHAANLSTWLFAFLILTVVWRLAAIPYPKLMPGRWTLGLLMLLGIGNVILNVNLFDGRVVGTALLVVMLGLKLLELNSRRDVYVCVYLGFFLALTQFLFHQNLWLALYLFALCGMLGALLVMLNRVHVDTRRTLTTSARIIVSALPAALALFLLFPRLENPLWAIQVEKPRGITGISDRMEMGSIGELSQSSATAFRARFDGPAPQPEQRYWRGLVLWHFDGITWLPAASVRRPAEVEVDNTSQLNYEITLEPSQQPWVFALDMPRRAPQPLILNDDLRIISPEPIVERSTFKLQAHTRYKVDTLTRRQRDLGLTLPSNISPRTQQLVAKWRAEHNDDPAKVVQAALNFFNQENFIYSLTPGSIQEDPVDQFLFETRRGFCEHYAGSFAVLMRLAGIPTRIVLGYQGGEYNPRAEHWVVRQSDAHAWNEVWLADRGWVRIDPTAAVAPERIEQSIDTEQSNDADQVIFRIADDSLVSGLLREAGWMLDAAEIGWHRWVLGFSRDRQTSLLQNLGFKDLKGYEYGLAIAATLGLGIAFAYIVSVLRKRPQTDQTLYLWEKLLNRMQRKGLEIPAWFGPQQVLQAAVKKWPDQKVTLQKIVRLYIHLRYGRVSRQENRQQMQRYMRRLKLT